MGFAKMHVLALFAGVSIVNSSCQVPCHGCKRTGYRVAKRVVYRGSSGKSIRCCKFCRTCAGNGTYDGFKALVNKERTLPSKSEQARLLREAAGDVKGFLSRAVGG